VRSRLAAVPPWAWLAGIVVASAALRIWLVSGMVAPFVFVDEAIYTELARSLADSGSYAVRELPVSGYSLLYPALIAPAYGLFDGLVDAYTAAKVTNAVVMSLAAVPAYLLARRVVVQRLALLAAAIAVAVPSMAYAGTITTESLFYPVSLAFALLLVRYLERPGYPRLAGVGVGLAVAFATRSQSLAFVPALATAPLVLAALRRRVDVVRPFVPLYVLGGAAVLALVVLQTARGESLADLLGAYSIVGEGGYDVGRVLRFWLWHVEELDLYAGILPFAALLVLLARGHLLPERVQEHIATTVSVAVWSTLAVGAFASRFASDRIQDRYLFFLVPLLVACLLVWVERPAARGRVETAAAGGAALVLPLLFPYTRFIGEPAKSDTLGLIPLWSANEHLVAGRYWVTVAVVGGALVALWLLAARRYPVAAPFVVLALFVVLSRPVWSGPNGFLVASRGALFQGIQQVPRDWIDRAVPPGQEVVVLWTGHADRFTVNQAEFFNRRVGRVFYTSEPTPGGINETPVTRVDTPTSRAGREGTFFLPNDAHVVAPYALLDGSVTPDGVVVARDEGTGMSLWRLTGPLSSRETVKGLYADTWSGPRVRWRLVRCKSGTLTVTVHSDPSLFRRGQALRARTRTAEGYTETSIGVASTGDRVMLRTPVTPRSGECSVELTVAPTAVPSKVLRGSTDDRELGLHFDAFAYEPKP
jgi:hypothetical protein